MLIMPLGRKMVTSIIEHVKPFTPIIRSECAFYVLEVPSGVVSRSNTKIGDKISFQVTI